MTTGGDGGVVAPGRRPEGSTTDALLAEAMVLAEAVRQLLLAGGARDPMAPGGAVASLGRLQRAAKLGELTALLGHAVAWLLTRKAVEAGELSPAEGAAPARRLASLPSPTQQELAVDRPGRLLAELEGRVRALHGRLARLDRLLDGPADSV